MSHMTFFFFYCSINNSVPSKQIVIGRVFFKSIYVNLNMKMDDYSPKIKINVKNMNDS